MAFVHGFGFAAPCAWQAAVGARRRSVVPVRAAGVKGPVDDSNVPEGHRGLHETLYGDGAEAEHGSGNDSGYDVGFSSDGDEVFDVDIALKVLQGRKIAGVYAVMNEGREVEYVGISRSFPTSLSAHR